MIQIKFLNPEFSIKGEGQSKLLDEKSDIYRWIKKIQKIFNILGIFYHSREPHIQISHPGDKEDIKRQRALQLHNKYIQKNIDLIRNKALVINTGLIEGYGETHATVAYFKEGLDENRFNDLKKICLGVPIPLY